MCIWGEKFCQMTVIVESYMDDAQLWLWMRMFGKIERQKGKGLHSAVAISIGHEHNTMNMTQMDLRNLNSYHKKKCSLIEIFDGMYSVYISRMPRMSTKLMASIGRNIGYNKNLLEQQQQQQWSKKKSQHMLPSCMILVNSSSCERFRNDFPDWNNVKWG